MPDFIPLAKPDFSPTAKKLVNDCLDTGWISSIGKYVEQFGQNLAKYIGVKYALPVSNGTAALHLALIALEIGPGDEVIVPALTFVASVNAIKYVGAKPVFVDVEADTFNLDLSKLEEKITKKTKAIMTVDLYGHPVDFSQVAKICQKHNLKFISDSAESLGSLYKGRPTGSQADISTFSFFGNKIITTGEGGMVVTDNLKLYQLSKLYRDQGKDTSVHNYYHPVIGYNYGLTNLQAAVGISQLKRLKKFVHQKRSIANKYLKLLKDTPGLSFQLEQKYAKSNWWMFSVLVDKERFGRSRDELMDHLLKKHIETRPFFYPMHMLPPYKKEIKPTNFPITKTIASQGMNLRSFSSLSSSQVKHICHAIISARR